MPGLMSGFLAFVWQALRSPRTPLVILLWLAAGALVGLASGPGEHPAEGILLHAPAVLLPFAVAARVEALPGQLWAAGAALALVGTLFAGGGAGSLRADLGGTTEAYSRPVGGRDTPFHLGGVLSAAVDDETHLALRLAAAGHEMGMARLSLVDGREQRLGPWQVRFRQALPGNAPDRARLRATAEGQPPRDLTLREGQGAALPDGTRVQVSRLAADFGQSLGPAAELIVEGPEGRRTDWVFVDSPDLDARLGSGRWRFDVLGVDATPGFELEVHKSGLPWGVAAGWAVMALALLALALRRPGGTP